MKMKTEEQIKKEIKDWTEIGNKHMENKNVEGACQVAHFISALRWCLDERFEYKDLTKHNNQQ